MTQTFAMPSSTCSIEDLPTPAIVIDRSIVQANLARLATYAKRHGIAVRPHTKTHKSQAIATMQLAAGAIGLTVAKVGEAELMGDVSSDILMAYPAVDPARTQRLAQLAQRITIRVAVDSVKALDALNSAAMKASAKIGVLIDMDVGMGRTGVPSPEASHRLAQEAARLPGLRLDGLMIYPGQIWALPQNQSPLLQAIAEKTQAAMDLWKRSGLTCDIVSGGSTPTAYQSHFIPQLTEIRPGTYVFNDLNEVRAGYATLEQCAARIYATVVSDAVSNQVVLDCGTKTLTSDLCSPARDSGHGFICEYADAKIVKLSEEHAQVDVSQCARRPEVGERVSVIPNHICPCINLMNRIWWHDGHGQVTAFNVDARGLLS